jgi:hypothetical protein
MESGLRDRTKAGSSLRHWPPGTNSKTFVPPFFVRRKSLKQSSPTRLAQSFQKHISKGIISKIRDGFRFRYLPV